MPVEYDTVGAGRLEGEEHAEAVAVGQAADSIVVVVDVVYEQRMADEPRHFDVDLFLALTAAELQGEINMKLTGNKFIY